MFFGRHIWKPPCASDDANNSNGLTSFGDLESTHRDHEKKERVIGEEDDGSTVAAAPAAATQNWSPETISRPEKVDEDSRTKSFYFRQDINDKLICTVLYKKKFSSRFSIIPPASKNRR